MVKLGERLKAFRTEYRYSQETLAGMVHISRSSISKWENNSSIPSFEQLKALSEIYHVTLTELTDGIDRNDFPLTLKVLLSKYLDENKPDKSEEYVLPEKGKIAETESDEKLYDGKLLNRAHQFEEYLKDFYDYISMQMGKSNNLPSLIANLAFLVFAYKAFPIGLGIIVFVLINALKKRWNPIILYIMAVYLVFYLDGFLWRFFLIRLIPDLRPAQLYQIIGTGFAVVSAVYFIMILFRRYMKKGKAEENQDIETYTEEVLCDYESARDHLVIYLISFILMYYFGRVPLIGLLFSLLVMIISLKRRYNILFIFFVAVFCLYQVDVTSFGLTGKDFFPGRIRVDDQSAPMNNLIRFGLFHLFHVIK